MISIKTHLELIFYMIFVYGFSNLIVSFSEFFNNHCRIGSCGKISYKSEKYSYKLSLFYYFTCWIVRVAAKRLLGPCTGQKLISSSRFSLSYLFEIAFIAVTVHHADDAAVECIPNILERSKFWNYPELVLMIESGE